MPFEKGQSGNPAGRKAGVPNRSTKELRDLLRSKVDFEGLIEKLSESAKQGDLQATKFLFEYAYGRPQGFRETAQDEFSESFG